MYDMYDIESPKHVQSPINVDSPIHDVPYENHVEIPLETPSQMPFQTQTQTDLDMNAPTFTDLLFGSNPSTHSHENLAESSKSIPTKTHNETENDTYPSDIDCEDDEPQYPYMHESEDEEIGFVRCVQSNDESDEEFDEIGLNVTENEGEANDQVGGTVQMEGSNTQQPNSKGKLRGGRPKGSGKKKVATDVGDDSGDDIDIEVDELVEDEFVSVDDWGREFEVGQVFPSKEELRKRVKEYIIRVGFTCLRHKNDGVRYTVSCDGKGCPFG
ncbi:hypothetical protein OROMI_031899 [Orobanche minor]